MYWSAASTWRWLRPSNWWSTNPLPGRGLDCSSTVSGTGAGLGVWGLAHSRTPLTLLEIDWPVVLLETDPSVVWQVILGILAMTCLAAMIGAIAAASLSTTERTTDRRSRRTGDGTDDDEDDRPLDDEQRVLALLEENGGRARQVEIVGATDWSKAKTSRVISRMADEGSVKKIPIGRENLVVLPEESPFEVASE